MKRPVLALVLAGLLLAASASSALATTTRLPFEEAVSVSVLDPGTITFNYPLYSVRGQVNQQTVTATGPGASYIAGTETVVVDFDLNIATGTGTMWATFHLTSAAHPDGGFDGSVEANFVSFDLLTGYAAWTGRGVSHGWGSLEGWQGRATMMSVPGGAASTGYMFRPGDKSD